MDYRIIREEDWQVIRRILDSADKVGHIDDVVRPVPIPPPADEPAIVGTRRATGFRFSSTTLKHMSGVHPVLCRVATLALEYYSTVDFGCTEDQSRTLAEQKAKVASGASQTTKSKHRIQPDGFAWALDLVAWVNGKWSWDWDHYFAIAFAMDQAATELGVAENIRWGGAWDRVLSDFGGEAIAYKREVESYKVRHPGRDFIDGPHFEWVS